MLTGAPNVAQKSIAKPVWYFASDIATRYITPSPDSSPATHMTYRPATRPAAT